MISVFILPSNIIFWKTERERVSEIAPARKEREREREREEEERAHHRRPTSLRLRRRPRDFALQTHEPIFDFASEPRAFDPKPEPSTHRSSTQSLRPTSLRLRRQPRAFDFAGNPRTDLSLSLCNFDLCVILIFVVVVVVWVVVFWWFFCCVVVGFACLPSVMAFDCRSLLPWVELEFRWCVVLFRWWV